MPDTDAYTWEFRLAGKWLKVFGYFPFQYSDTTKPGQYLSVPETKPLQFTLQTEKNDHDMLYVHSNFEKSGSAASSALDSNYIVPTNIPFKSSATLPRRHICQVQNCRESVFSCLSWEKSIFNYFTDVWGDRITDYIDISSWCWCVIVYPLNPTLLAERGESWTCEQNMNLS